MFRFIALAALLATAAAVRPRLDGRIVGGDDANVEDFPYQLSLQSYGSHICGASIISSKWAVTAAHCTDGSSASSLSLVAGISNLDESGQKIKIAKIHQNPQYSSWDIDYDISVLELATEIELGSTAQPVGLPSDGSDPAAGTDVVCSGWGTLYEGGYVSDQLQSVTVQIVSREDCNDQYGSGSITDRMICAGVPEGGKDACQGDSGGPLVANGQLVGIVSWGYGCARPTHAGVYSNVGALRSYIKEQSGL
ncbi:trypsin-7-like [Atheta coriaria]|uniref:trypsin-7-like n=1 Tax=Dalotia coriaria TaxID=877792 RepID=UPI0031F3D9F7